MTSKLSERSQLYVVEAADVGTTAATTSTIVDLQTLGYDSVMFFGSQVTPTTAAHAASGFSITARVHDTTVPVAAYGVTSPGTTKVALTANSTVAGEVIYIDMKQLLHRYADVTVVASTVSSFAVFALCYDSRSHAVTVSTDVATSMGVNAVQPTTTSA